ncbi:MAG: ribosome maturation factor RimP [Burkholderiaceae bacterium]|nr:ribosome maturation factor RimP [Burkholderiaceae bacterium]
MSWQQAIDRTVSALGYELVDVERSAGGLLRVTIDRVPGNRYESAGDAVTVDDCERVTRQLQYALDVDGIDYARLEVSSPGVDRPLKKPADWDRFAGSEVDLTLRSPFQGRKRWRGVLQPRDAGWRLLLPPPEGKAAGVAPAEALDFELSEVREARLVPQLDFKGRRARPAAAAPEAGLRPSGPPRGSGKVAKPHSLEEQR